MTWSEKFGTRKTPVVKKLEKDFSDIKKDQTMLISTPKEISDYLKENTKPGDFVTITKLRSDLAKKHLADKTCPVTTGIFLRIVSELAIEELNRGKDLSEVTPFWRIVDEKSPLSKKLSIPYSEVSKLKAKDNL